LGRKKMRAGLVWKSRRKRPLRRPTLRRKHILKMDLLNDLYCSPNIVRVIKSRKMRWARHVVRVGDDRCAYRVLVGKPERKRPLGRPRSRREDNIKMDLQDVGWEGMDWINPLTPNDLYMSRTAPVTSKRCILYVYSTNVGTEYFKHALYSPSFSLQNEVCFIMLTSLVPVLFAFYIQDVLKLKKNSGAKGLIWLSFDET